MVLAAAALVIAGLGLFVVGITTDATAWYWTCVAVCGLAGALLVLARRGAPAGTSVPAPTTGGRTALGAGGGTAADTASPGNRPGSPPAEPTAPVEPDPAGRPAEDDGGSSAVSGAPAARPVTVGRHARPVDGDPPEEDDGGSSAVSGAPAGRPVTVGRHARPVDGDPPEEDVEVTDLLLVVDLTDEVLVVDERPRYHRAGCPWLEGRETIPLPVREARTDGFTPCARCGPDAHLADVERARRAARRTT